MSDVFDQDAMTTEEAAQALGATIVPAAPSAALTSLEERFARVPRIEEGETAIRMALDILNGDPDAIGAELQKRSVRELKLANKVHVVTDIALARSTMQSDSGGPQIPYYALVEAVWPTTGETFSYSIGGAITLAQLVAWYSAGKLPHQVLIIEVPSRQGNPAYRYVDA